MSIKTQRNLKDERSKRLARKLKEKEKAKARKEKERAKRKKIAADKKLKIETERRLRKEQRLAKKQAIIDNQRPKKTDWEKLEDRAKAEQKRHANKTKFKSGIKSISIKLKSSSYIPSNPRRYVKVNYYHRKGGWLTKDTFIQNQRRSSKNFVAVRMRYYKDADYRGLYKHVARVVDETYDARKTQNVFEEYMSNNSSYEFRTLDDCDKAYQDATGKKPRSDFRKVIEQVVVFSEDQFIELENKYGADIAKEMLVEHLKLYAAEVNSEFGLEPMRLDLHLDEGTIDPVTGEFKRNVHCHIQFYNYDFVKCFAPLKSLLNKKICPNTKKRITNPAMSRFQDLAGDVFKDLGFRRGIKKAGVKKDHLEKNEYAAKKQKEKMAEIENMTVEHKERLAEIEKDIEKRRAELVEKENDLKKKQIAFQNKKQDLIDTNDEIKRNRDAIANELYELNSVKIQVEQDEKQIERIIDLMVVIRQWKDLIIAADLKKAREIRKDIIEKYKEIEKNDDEKSKKAKDFKDILSYEFSKADEFEKKYYVINEDKISEKIKIK